MLHKKIASRIFLLFLLLIPIHVRGDSKIEFKDIVGHWAEDTIEWAADSQLVNGFPDQTFRPDTLISESEFVAVLLRSFRMMVISDMDQWPDAYYAIAKEMNFPLSGMEQEEKRGMPISRASVAEIIAGADGKHYVGADAIRYILQKGYAQGKLAPEYSGVTVYSYRGEDELTRAEAIQFIKRLKEKGMMEIAIRPADESDPGELVRLAGEKLEGVQTVGSGPVLYSAFELDRGTVYFINSEVSPQDPSYRIRLKRKFNPHLNEHIYAIANSLYGPDKEKMGIWYSRKGSPKISIHFGTFDTSLQNQASPYFNKPFEYEVYEEHLDSKNEIASLRIHRLWGNHKPAELDDYYIQKLRSSLISFLGEKDGNTVSDALVEEMKVLIVDQAKVKDWALRIGSPELDYNRSQTMSLSHLDVSVFTTISGIQVAFYSKADRGSEADHYAVTPDGSYVVENKQAVPYKNIVVHVSRLVIPKGMVIVRASDEIVVRKEEVSTIYGTAELVERSFTYTDDPERIPQTSYNIVVTRTDPSEPSTTIQYILSSTVTGNEESAKQELLEISKGWVIPVEPK